MRLQFRAALAAGCMILVSYAHVRAQQAGETQKPALQLQVNVSKVLVPVVVRDKAGHVVADLKQEDFQLFDNGKPAVISSFTVEKRTGKAAAVVGEGSAGQTAGPSPPQDALPDRILIFLFDDMHLNFEDLTYAKQAGLKVIAESLTGSDMAAVVSTSGKTNSGLTRDAAKLDDAIKSLQPHGLVRNEKTDCPFIDYYQADLIENKRSPTATSDAIAKVIKCDPSLDPMRDRAVIENQMRSAVSRALTQGYQDVQVSFATIHEVVRRMSTLPGQRTLILVSPGFLNVEMGALTLESRILDLAAQSNVEIGAIDARGLYSGIVDASEHGNGQIVDPMRTSSLTLSENVMAELADGTGGTFYHNSNDLAAGFRTLTEAPEVVYLLEMSLDGVKQDGSSHRLKVKVDRDGVDVQARRGYFMPRAEKAKK